MRVEAPPEPGERGRPAEWAPRVTLDPAQQAAVNHPDGPCLVLAGPGSGKTRVIVERFLALLDRGVPADRQLVLTYTRKAASEMRDRAEAANGPFAGEPPLTNYHSFAQRVVRDWGWLIAISPAFRIPDDAERWLHLEAVLNQSRPRTLWNPLRPHDLVDSVLHVIGSAKQELVTPDQYSDWAQACLEVCTDEAERALLERHRECAEVYALLEERYKRHAILDHDDCILYAERLLREAPPARRATAERITHVMVDEYQDTNFAQARLVEALVADHGNILVVADDDQAIYKFRGASLANLDRFARLYPDHRRIVLSRNYRSRASIVAAAGAVIGVANPRTRIEKHLTAERGGGPEVGLWTAGEERSETFGIASECRRLIEGGISPDGIAWLFRRHVDMQPAIQALQQAEVPYQVHGGRGFFQQPEIKDILALLAVAATPADSQALLRCLHLPAWAVSRAGRRALVESCRSQEVPLHELITGERIAGLDPDDQVATSRCVADILEIHARVERDDVRDVFFAALEASRFIGMLDEHSELVRIQAGANLNKIGELLEAFVDWSDDRRLRPALRYLEILRNSRAADELAAIDTDQAGVALLTAHSAKGLEWPVVFVSGCIDIRWPGRGGGLATRLTLPDELVPEPTPLGDTALDEERRLFYVAVTRTRDRLVLSRAHRYPRSFRDERASPFLAALDTPAMVPMVGRLELPQVGAPPGPRRRVAGPPAKGPLAVSVIDIETYKSCPRRFGYRRIYHMPVAEAVQQWYGTLVHSVLQTAAIQRTAGISIGADEIAGIWMQAWDVSQGPKGVHPELRGYGEGQLRRYVRSPLWTERHFVGVELDFTIQFNSATVAGRFDRVDHRDDEPVTVVDYKTGPPKDVEVAARSLQVRAYAVAISQRHSVDRVAVELHFVQTAEVARVDFGKSELDRAYRHLSASVADLVLAWRTGEFPPRPSSWQCRRCEYRTVCDEGRQATAEPQPAVKS